MARHNCRKEEKRDSTAANPVDAERRFYFPFLSFCLNMRILNGLNFISNKITDIYSRFEEKNIEIKNKNRSKIKTAGKEYHCS